MNLLLGLVSGFFYITLAVGASDFDDEIYILHKDKSIPTNDAHKQQKKNKLQSNRDSLEFPFPLFPEWDEFSFNNLDGKLKDQAKTFQEEKDPFSDITDTQVSKIFKQKKKPKDKFIMTFTEFFIPVMNHKNFDFPSLPRKFDFFEDFFKDFPLKDFEEQPLLKHKRPKRFLDFNPFISFVRNTSSKITNLLNSNSTLKNMTKKMEARKLGSMLQKPNGALVVLQNTANGTIPVCCAGHTECRTNMHCKQGMCREQHEEEEEENTYIRRLKQMANINKLSKIMLFYTVPILLGIGGIIIAAEVIRKHNNAVKQVQFIKEYDPIQHC